MGTARGKYTSLSITHALKHSWKPLALGLLRWATTTSIDYQLHVTEYGYHWNFFFTLGCLPVLTAVIHTAFGKVSRSRWQSDWLLGVIVACAYEILLQTSLQAWIMREDGSGQLANRQGLINMNKEGICSLLGYISIFFFGMGFGKAYSNSGAIKAWRSRLLMLYLLSAILYFGFGAQTSRRLANGMYVLITTLFNITGVLTCHHFLPSMDDSKLSAHSFIDRVNRYSLPLFLIANLLTGCVNIMIKTLDSSHIEAFAILLGYTATLTVITTWLP
jgi:phosphatidylinositol glycan class W